MTRGENSSLFHDAKRSEEACCWSGLTLTKQIELKSPHSDKWVLYNSFKTSTKLQKNQVLQSDNMPGMAKPLCYAL